MDLSHYKFIILTDFIKKKKIREIKRFREMYGTIQRATDSTLIFQCNN